MGTEFLRRDVPIGLAHPDLVHKYFPATVTLWDGKCLGKPAAPGRLGRTSAASGPDGANPLDDQHDTDHATRQARSTRQRGAGRRAMAR